MRRRTILASLTLILAVILPLTVAADDPPAPTTRHQARMDGLPVTGPAEVFTHVFETQPGSKTPRHTHPVPLLGTVIEGELTMTIGGVEKVYKTGESFIERGRGIRGPQPWHGAVARDGDDGAAEGRGTLHG